MCSYIQNKVEFKDIRSELNVQKYPQSPFNILVQQKNRTFQCMVMPMPTLNLTSCVNQHNFQSVLYTWTPVRPL